MVKATTARSGALLVSALLAGALLVSFLVARSASASPSATVKVVQTAKNAQLKKTVLVTRKGLTLYSLSAEKRGRFICTNTACLSLWTPLDVAKGTKPAGSARLGTIRRPDGHIQVTYRGLPLYTFNPDKKKGDVKGEGFKDVGTWHAASPQKAAASQPPSQPSPYPYGG
jgi:predicted lipoprotein with Yx(FWY)xxD motif